MTDVFCGEREFIQRYDQMILHPFMRQLYAGSAYYNVGDWSAGPNTLEQACDQLTDRVVALLPPTQGRILDAGCGLGAGTRRLASQRPQAQVLGINLSGRQLAGSSRHGHTIQLLAMDAVQMAFAPDSFHGMVSIEAAFHFLTRTRFLREAQRVLKLGAVLVLTDILFDGTPWIGSWTVPPQNLGSSLDAYAAECEKAGFEVISLEDITTSTWDGYIAYLPHWANRAAREGLLAESEITRMAEFAQGMAAVPACYLIASLRKAESI